MITQPLAPNSFPLQELEDIDAAIAASLRLVETWTLRRDRLRTQLEALTRPTLPKAPVVDRRPRFEYRGTSFAHWSNVSVYHELLRRLWVDFPDRRDHIASVIGIHGTLRRYVAASRDQLFVGKTKGWAQRHSRGLVDGWFVDTNLNVERMAKIVVSAVEAAGLSWNKDVTVRWR